MADDLTPFEQLLLELYSATADGRVKWGETADENSFRAKLGQGWVRVSEHDEDYYAYLIDPQGRTIDGLADRDTKIALTQLYSLARRSAYDIDGLVSRMLGDLRSGKVIPAPPPEKKRDPGPDDIPF